MKGIIFVFTLFLLARHSFAQTSQPQWFLGVIGGCTFNEHYNISSMNNPANIISTANGTGFSLGLASQYRLNDTGGRAILFNVYYEQKPGNTTVLGMPYFSSNPKTGEAYLLQSQQNTAIQYNLLNVEVLYKINVPVLGLEHLGVALGPKLGYAVTSSYYAYRTTVPTSGSPIPPGYPFPDTTLASGAIAGAKKFQIALSVNIQYEIPLGDFMIIPAIMSELNITTITGSWGVNTSSVVIEAMYAL